MAKKIFFLILAIFTFPATQCYASHGWLVYFEGAFSGKIYDAVTKEPVEGAAVVAQYNIRTCGPLYIPTCGTEDAGFKETLTERDGSFLIYPRIFAYPWPFTLGGEESSLVVFKPGYKLLHTYIKNIQKRNEIALEPVSEKSHRLEELYKAEGVYGVEWRDTHLLKDMITQEKKFLQTDEYAPLFFAPVGPGKLVQPKVTHTPIEDGK